MPGSANMDILLWRHAEAEDGADDMNRALTARGHDQAKKMGAWIRKYAPEDLRIVSSPATRARQTAEALRMPFDLDERLAPGRSVDDHTALCFPGTQGRSTGHSPTVLLVGHQPTLGQLAALLLTGTVHDWAIKKAGLWWIRRPSENSLEQTRVVAVLDPSLTK